jgi:DMSO/TMAO reductase YedYZ molybdopterin-dependent catalytic subunit
LPKSKPLGETGDVGFFERNRDDVAKLGYDPKRLPPGQYLTERFPVLHVGDVPEYAPGEWNLRVFGMVDDEYTLTFEELTALPSVELVTDIHCVTKWSKFDTRWRGVKVSELLARAGMKSGSTHFMGHAEYGYTANLPIEDVLLDESLVVYEYEGEPIEPIHGGPVRLLVPHLYFWKSPKWLRGLEVRTADAPGFWERNGYNMYGDPFLEQRFWGD